MGERGGKNPKVENVPHIFQIELRGFKSFGNSKVSIPLSKGLTAIVGPNGIGKSNIVDGLCFVLGEMSAKAMRAERLSGLLFKGGNGYRPAPFAEVSLHFNNDDGKLPINSQTAVISRRVDRSGKCVYKINKKRASRQEIVDLLAASMASPGGHNFVMQGDVNRFVNMGSNERRLIIDDLAGVAEYDEKKQKSMGELQKVQTNLDQVDTVLREISAQMESLRAQMETTIRHKQLNLELEQTRGALLLIRKEKHAKKLSQLKQRMGKLEKKIQELRDRHQAIIEEINKHDEKIGSIEELIDEKKSAEVLVNVERARTQINILNELLASNAEKQSNINREISTLTEQIKKIRGPDSEISKNRFVSLSSEFKALREKFTALNKSLDGSKSPTTTRNILQQVKAVLNNLASVVDGLSNYVDYLSRPSLEPDQEPTVSDMREKLIGLNAKRAELGEEIKNLKQRVNEAQSQLELTETSEKEIRSFIETLGSERKELRDRVRGLEEKARVLDSKIRRLEGGLQEQRIKKVSLETELSGMNAELKKIKCTTTPPTDASVEVLERKADALGKEIEFLGEVNQRAVRDFRETERRHNAEKLKFDKLVAEKQSLLDFMHGIDEKKKEVFMKTFNEISRHFGKIFSELSPGGTAELVLENEETPFEGGLEIKARPGGAEVSYVGELSGGQKALTALAFIFALQRYRPTTFYVLDEIDAHLDPKNRKRVAEMLRQFSRESQIVVITLHDAIMSVADRLFGVTMENKISRLFSVELSGLGG